MGKCFIKVRIHCFLYLNLAFFLRIMRFSSNCAIGCHNWGQLCEITPSRNIRWPDKCKLHIWDPRYTFHTYSLPTPPPPPLPFHQSLYRQIGLDGCTLTSCMTKIYRVHSVQVSAGKLEAGFLETLLCMLHFLYVDVIAISKANLSMDYQQYMYMELTKYLIVQFTCMKDWEHQKILLISH